MCLVVWPLNGSEAGVDFVLIETSLPFLCQSFWNFFFFPANYALLFGELCTKNAKSCANYVNAARCCTIFFTKKFKCFSLLSLQIFFGFTFNTKLSIFKARTREGKFNILPSRQGSFFFSELWLVIFLRTMARDI